MRIGSCVVLLVIILFTPTFTEQLIAEEPQGIKGCYATYYPQDGKFRFEPFLKTRDKEYSDQDGEPEIWGLRPWSESSKKDGKLTEVNVMEARFIPLGRAKKVPAGTMQRMVKCPDGYW